VEFRVHHAVTNGNFNNAVIETRLTICKGKRYYHTLGEKKKENSLE
jgi:hypothetical protein